jgi:hypothetical protein
MAFVHGKSAYFSLGSAGSETVLVDVSSYANELSLPQSIETGETTTFGKDSKTYVVGLKDSTVSMAGFHDLTIDAHLFGALGNATPLNFLYSPEGNETGDVKYTGACFITSYEIGSPIGDVVSYSAELQVTGDVTRAIVS